MYNRTYVITLFCTHPNNTSSTVMLHSALSDEQAQAIKLLANLVQTNRKYDNQPNMFIYYAVNCTSCRATGYIGWQDGEETPCLHCNGTGRMRGDEVS
jgi:hypothetical protein